MTEQMTEQMTQADEAVRILLEAMQVIAHLRNEGEFPEALVIDCAQVVEQTERELSEGREGFELSTSAVSTLSVRLEAALAAARTMGLMPVYDPDEDEQPSYYSVDEVQGAGEDPGSLSQSVPDIFGAVVYLEDGIIQARPTTRNRQIVDIPLLARRRARLYGVDHVTGFGWGRPRAGVRERAYPADHRSRRG